MCIKVFDYKVILFITAILASSLIPTYQLQAQGLQISFEYLENRQIIRRDSLSELHKNNIGRFNNLSQKRSHLLILTRHRSLGSICCEN